MGINLSLFLFATQKRKVDFSMLQLIRMFLYNIYSFLQALYKDVPDKNVWMDGNGKEKFTVIKKEKKEKKKKRKKKKLKTDQ